MCDPEPCRLLELPAELRNEIYEYVLHQPNGVAVSLWASKHDEEEDQRQQRLQALPASPSPMQAGHPMALTGVSKQIRNECAKLFLANNHFKLSLPLMSKLCIILSDHEPISWNHAEQTLQWLNGLGNDLSLLQSVHIDLGDLRTISKEHKTFLLHVAAWIGELGNTFRRRRVHLTIAINMHEAKTGLPGWTIPYSSYSRNAKCLEAILTSEREMSAPGAHALAFPRFVHHLRTRHKWLQWFNAWVRICHVLSGKGRKGVRHMGYDELVVAWEEWRVASSRPKALSR